MSAAEQGFAVAYPSLTTDSWQIIESQKRDALLLSEDLRIICLARRNVAIVSARRDSSMQDGTLVQWPNMEGHVRFSLGLGALAGLAPGPFTISAEVTASILPQGAPLECSGVVLIRPDGKGWYPIQRRIAEQTRFTRTDTQRRWPITLTSEELAQEPPLELAIQFPGAETALRLDHFGIRVQAIETATAAFTASIGGMVEGWTRAEDAVLRLGAEPVGAIEVGFGRFARALSPPQAGGPAHASIVAGGALLAYLDLSCPPAGAAPAPDAMAAWLHDQGRIELIWTLLARGGADALPEAARQDLILHEAALLLGMNAAESAYRGLSEASGPDAALAPGLRRKMRLRLARACLRSGRAPEAETVLREMQAADPLDWEPYFLLATIASGEDAVPPRTYLAIADSLAPKLPGTALTTLIEDLVAQGRGEEAWLRALRELKAQGSRLPDLWLALGNVHLARGDRLNWGACLRRLFAEHGLAEPEVGLAGDPAEDVFHQLAAPAGLAAPADQRDLITVVMTTYNAERTVKGAVRSVLAQTYRNLRLVVVDDGSTDDTMLLLRQMRERDDRVEILRTPFNLGTYCAKNLALGRLEGDYVTFHDSDDWMHPERLALHHAAMRADPRLICTTSRWFRMDLRGSASLRRAGGYLHDNPASTFFHRSLVERIGYFDSVRTGADSELLQRVRRRFGPAGTAVIAKPLAIGLHHSASLTRSGISAFDRHRFSAPRVAYWEASMAWHRRAVLDGTEARDLYMPFPHHPRRFPAPEAIVPDRIDELADALHPARAERLRALP